MELTVATQNCVIYINKWLLRDEVNIKIDKKLLYILLNKPGIFFLLVLKNKDQLMVSILCMHFANISTAV